MGLIPADSRASYTVTSPFSVSLTTAGKAVFPYLTPANPIAVAGQGTTRVRVYHATYAAAPNATTTLLLALALFTVAATHTTSDGREIRALTMDNGSTLVHSLAFGYGVINWVTKSIFLGSRRVPLNPEINDRLPGKWICTQHSTSHVKSVIRFHVFSGRTRSTGIG
jgi:hypothetical protein